MVLSLNHEQCAAATGATITTERVMAAMLLES